MKSIAAKFNTAKLKELALKHGEKIGFGCVALLVLGCLLSTSWKGYQKLPQELSDKARNADTQLASSQWTAEKQVEFKPMRFDEAVDESIFRPVDVAQYDYQTLMSPRLYAQQEPIDDPTFLPVVDLIATPGVFVMAVATGLNDPLAMAGDPSMMPAEGGVGPDMQNRGRLPLGEGVDPDFAPRRGGQRGGMGGPGGPGGLAGYDPAMDIAAEGPGRGSKKKKKGKGRGLPEEELMSPEMMGAEMMQQPLAEGRGVRYVAVRGIVPLRQQMERIQKGLHLETIAQAAEYIEYLSFKIERQKAIAGDEPWAGDWEELNIQSAIDVLSESEDFDLDIVPTEFTDATFTMPLPMRIVGYWQNQISHPKLKEYQLTLEKQMEELAKNSAALDLFTENGASTDGMLQKGGFASIQRDMRGIRTQVSADEVGKRMMQYMDPGMAGSMPGGGMGMPGGGMAEGGMGMGRSGSIAAVQMLLFRYLDFAVEPGECYRYRVTLTLRNPNYDLPLEMVRRAEVSQGETRVTPASEPSVPIVVQNDVDYFLKRVPKPRGRSSSRDEAEFEVFQWDPQVGTTIAATMRDVFGQYVGGTRKTQRLNVATPSLEEESVTFAAKDILVDAAFSPPLSPEAVAALNLPKNYWRKASEGGPFELAVSVNQFGELIRLDPVTREQQRQYLEKRVEREREEYQYLLEEEEEAENSLDALIAEGMPEGENTRGRRKRVRNPTRMGAGSSPMGAEPGGRGKRRSRMQGP